MAEKPEFRSETNKVFSHTLSDAELLRGMQTYEALRSGALIYGDAAGSEETWQLSKTVHRIRWFISHNWTVSRWAKFGVLCLHFNWYPACCVTALALAVIFVLTGMGLVPLVELFEYSQSDRLVWSGVLGRPIATWVFMITLFTWHEFAGRFGMMQQPVFLDKTCISQTDPELKQKGISSLAGFLSNSDGMLVVYSPVYLRKMWTVYELATVLILFPEMPVKVVPILLPPFFGGACLLFYAYYQVLFFWSWTATGEHLGHADANVALTSVIYVMEAVVVILMRWLAKKECGIERDAAEFRIAEAKVFDERDRKPVCASVAHFMRESGRVAPEAPHKVCLEAFDELVRQTVPQFLRAAFDRGLPYDMTLVLLLPVTGIAVDESAAGYYKDEDVKTVFHTLLVHVGIQFMILPVGLKLAALLCHSCLELEGFANGLYTAGICVLIATLTTGMYLAAEELAMWEEEGSGVDEVIEGVAWFLLFILAVYLYRPQQVPRGGKEGVIKNEVTI